jgi:hypothetical protein
MRFEKSDLLMRIGIAATLAISGVVHAYLYAHGYRHIPTIGTAFLVQGSAFVALAILILAGGPAWLRVAAGLGSAGALLAFGMSRTTGLFGFTETGWDPPYGVISVVVEALTVALCLAWAFAGERPGRRATAKA